MDSRIKKIMKALKEYQPEKVILFGSQSNVVSQLRLYLYNDLKVVVPAPISIGTNYSGNPD